MTESLANEEEEEEEEEDWIIHWAAIVRTSSELVNEQAY